MGGAIIAASDRMLTNMSQAIEYSSDRGKFCIIAGNRLILVSGEIQFHTEALTALAEEIGPGPASTRDVAETYGRIVGEIRHKRAAQRVLVPIGLTSSSFLAEQGSLSPRLVSELAADMQREPLDAEALVLGCEGLEARIYAVDETGVVSRHDNQGFASVGLGGLHANAYFMRKPYTIQTRYHEALIDTYSAKKYSEVAPGVGHETDMFIVSRDGVFQIPESLIGVLESLYREARASTLKVASKLQKRLAKSEQQLFAPKPIQSE